MTGKVLITEAHFEALLDHAVWNACNRDHGYIFAANASEQSEAEQRIERRCVRELSERYEVK